MICLSGNAGENADGRRASLTQRGGGLGNAFFLLCLSTMSSPMSRTPSSSISKATSSTTPSSQTGMDASADWHAELADGHAELADWHAELADGHAESGSFKGESSSMTASSRARRSSSPSPSSFRFFPCSYSSAFSSATLLVVEFVNRPLSSVSIRYC